MSQLTEAKIRLKTALGSFRIKRLPARKSETLQAWDAADELLLDNLATEHALVLEEQISNENRLLIINDQFGALTTTLNRHAPDSWNDSSISHLAAQLNHQENFKTDSDGDKDKDKDSDNEASFNAIASTDSLTGSYAIVLIKIPKTLSLLDQQLSSLSQHITSETIIIAAGMTKLIHSSTLALFEKHLGETTTSRATKKARLIFCKIDSKIIPAKTQPAQALITTRYFADPLNSELISYANGFSRDRLDLGARAMMQAMDENTLPDAENIADLACGNGVLGLHALTALGKDVNKVDKQRCITFIDESYMAVAAAKENYQQVISDAAKHNIVPSFVVQDSIKKPDINYDWIICNPPFHIGTAMDTYIANRMFQQSFIALQRTGQLWVVANRHLKYEDQIKKIFKNSTIILSNKKFVVIVATKM